MKKIRAITGLSTAELYRAVKSKGVKISQMAFYKYNLSKRPTMNNYVQAALEDLVRDDFRRRDFSILDLFRKNK